MGCFRKRVHNPLCERGSLRGGDPLQVAATENGHVALSSVVVASWSPKQRDPSRYYPRLRGRERRTLCPLYSPQLECGGSPVGNGPFLCLASVHKEQYKTRSLSWASSNYARSFSEQAVFCAWIPTLGPARAPSLRARLCLCVWEDSFGRLGDENDASFLLSACKSNPFYPCFFVPLFPRRVRPPMDPPQNSYDNACGLSDTSKLY